MGCTNTSLAAATLVALSGVLGCTGADAPAGPPPGVVVLVVDTLRWDALAAPPGGATRLPSLARLAADGVTFAEASAPAPWTLPSVTSLLTGLLPRRHGSQMSFSDANLRRVPPTVETLAKRLHAAGWSTAACTAGGWVSPELGLGGGFDQFTTNFDLHDPEFLLAPWQDRRPKDRPFFLFLHTCAAHDPYGDKDVPLALECRSDPAVREVGDRLVAAVDSGGGADDPLYADFAATRLSDPCARRALDQILGPQRNLALLARFDDWAWTAWRRAPSADLPSRLAAAYERGLGYVDRRIDRTLRTLDRLGLPKETVVVVAGDHGESFGEQGHLYHGQSLHDSVLKVPLVIRAAGRLPAGRVAQGGCSLVDVAPTVLDLAGVAAPPDLDGRSLVALATGREGGHAAIAEGEVAGTPQRAALGLASVRLPSAKWVLVYDPVSGRPLREEVYDLVADPDERAPRPASEGASLGAEFCRAVDAMRREMAARYGFVAPEAVCH